MGNVFCNTSSMLDRLESGCSTEFGSEKESCGENRYLLTVKERERWKSLLSFSDAVSLRETAIKERAKHPVSVQISKDITRTYPEEVFFGSKANLIRFETLLNRLALCFPRIGYTQGINFLAGYLLLCGFNDDEALLMLHGLCADHNLLLIGLYEDDFPLQKVYIEVFWAILEQEKKPLANKLQEIGLADEMWLFQWILTCFLYSISLVHIKELWGFILEYKGFAIVQLAYGLIRCLKKQIMEVEDECEMLVLLCSLKNAEIFRNMISVSKILDLARSISPNTIKQILKKSKLVENKYQQYFSSNEHNQSLLYQKQCREWVIDQHSFFMGPTTRTFNRKREDTFKLEELITEQIKSLNNSRTEMSFSSLPSLSQWRAKASVESLASSKKNPQHFKLKMTPTKEINIHLK